ncbi:MAZZA [Hibiscus trionum]|uniref:MAZZA n=1 Tax=Hibiscus trionum TaxID=183268 RepID=A0A9W7IY54_HIBTR|nr:MAZZA [Hibiscus trionum]
MRRWLCCSPHVEENHRPCETQKLKCPKHKADGHQKNSKVAAPVKPEERELESPIEVPALSLEELEEKTDNFGSSALIGEGSYGRVYYADLDNGKAVAVKKLDVSSEPEPNSKFLTHVC